jgi:hypothetical protein
MKPSEIETRPYTHFRDTRPGELERERECFRLILEGIEPRSVLDVFCGLGVFAGALRRRPDSYVAWDRDLECVERFASEFPGALVVRRDSFNAEGWPAAVDLVSLDFNTFTLLRYRTVLHYRGLVDRSFATAERWVQFTDSAVSKLHLNAGVYGPEVADLASYLAAWNREVEGFGIVAVAYHSGAAYLLWRRGAEGGPPAPRRVR